MLAQRLGCPKIRARKAEPVFDSMLSFSISTEYLMLRPENYSAGVLHGEFIPGFLKTKEILRES